jgi:rhombotail lipoprotein
VSYDQVSILAPGSSLRYRTIVGVQTLTGASNEVQNFVDTAIFNVATLRLLFRVAGVSSVERRPAPADADADSRESQRRGFALAAADMATNLDKELNGYKDRIR